MRAWRRAGSPAPPPRHFKRRLLRETARARGLRTVVETGTWKGGTIAALLGDVDRIVSIELDPAMAEAARRRFVREPQVEVLCGDSATVLPRVLAGLAEPALFWLDAHWSEGPSARGAVDTPIREEIEAILAHPVRGHVLLVDDARLFTGRDDYPTVGEVEAMVAARRPDLEVRVEDDVLRIAPRDGARP